MAQELAPPATLPPPLALTPPEPVQVVLQSQADGMLKLSEQETAKLDTKVNEFITAVLSLDAQSDSFKNKVNAIHNLGNEEVRAAAGASNRFLDRPIKALNNTVMDHILDLRRTVEDLDTSKQGNLSAQRKLLGLIPWGTRWKTIFANTNGAEPHPDHHFRPLPRAGRTTQRQRRHRTGKGQFVGINGSSPTVYIGKKIDAALEVRIAEVEMKDQEKARVVRGRDAFYVRQKAQDLLTQLAVSIQGIWRWT